MVVHLVAHYSTVLSSIRDKAISFASVGLCDTVSDGVGIFLAGDIANIAKAFFPGKVVGHPLMAHIFMAAHSQVGYGSKPDIDVVAGKIKLFDEKSDFCFGGRSWYVLHGVPVLE